MEPTTDVSAVELETAQPVSGYIPWHWGLTTREEVIKKAEQIFREASQRNANLQLEIYELKRKNKKLRKKVKAQQILFDQIGY